MTVWPGQGCGEASPSSNRPRLERPADAGFAAWNDHDPVWLAAIPTASLTPLLAA
jgi:hypothetical protein